MPLHVTSNTGHEYFVAAGVGIHPSEPTVVDELTPEMEFHAVNLHVQEVDDKGKPVVREDQPKRETVSARDYDAVASERDDLKSKLEKSSEGAEKAKQKAEADADEAKAKIARLERLIPSTASAIGALGIDKLKELATHRGVKVEGEDKAAYVAALSPKADPAS